MPVDLTQEVPSPAEVTYSVVVPVYGNADTLAALLERLRAVASGLDGPLEAVFVVDGSPDGSLALLRRLLPEAGIASQLLIHSRNFGSFPAIRTGLAAARGRYVAVMAADLQEPPELLSGFFAALSTGDHDVAVGRREGRADPALTTAASRTFWALYRRTVNPDIPRGGVDVFACTREVATTLLGLAESHSSLVAQLYWVGYRRTEVPYARQERAAGRSGWTLSKRVHYLMDSVFAFTHIPITALTLVGLIGTLVTTIAALTVLVSWLTGGITEVGYTPLMLAILFSAFLTLSGLGVVGSYVWRTYENSKHRPVAITRSHESFPAVSPGPADD